MKLKAWLECKHKSCYKDWILLWYIPVIVAHVLQIGLFLSTVDSCKATEWQSLGLCFALGDVLQGLVKGSDLLSQPNPPNCQVTI